MGRNRLCFILIKDFLSKMIKKTKSWHFVCLIFSTSKTLKVKILYSTKIFEKIAEIINKTVKKYNSSVTSKILWKKPTNAASGAFEFTRLLSVWSWPEFMFEVWVIKMLNFFVENCLGLEQNPSIIVIWLYSNKRFYFLSGTAPAAGNPGQQNCLL